MNTVREIDAFYEAAGPFAVERERAASIYEAAISNVGLYVGGIALKSLRGINIPITDSPINHEKIQIPVKSSHKFLLTKRQLLDKSDTVTGVSSLRYTDSTRIVVGSFAKVNVPPRDIDMFNGMAIATTVHEMGHTFGLDHCRKKLCIMQAGVDLKFRVERVASLNGNAFCDECAEDLELAGYQELAQKL